MSSYKGTKLSKRRRARRCGFRVRMRLSKNVIKSRRIKKRNRLTVVLNRF